MKSKLLAALFTTITALSIPVQAMEKMQMPAAEAEQGKSIEGEGVIVSKSETGDSVTLKHQPIPAIGWPAMTMGFKVKDKALLEQAKQGDKVKFTMIKEGKNYVITDLR